MMHHIISFKDKPVRGALQLSKVTVTIQFVSVGLFGFINTLNCRTLQECGDNGAKLWF